MQSRIDFLSSKGYTEIESRKMLNQYDWPALQETLAATADAPKSVVEKRQAMIKAVVEVGVDESEAIDLLTMIGFSSVEDAINLWFDEQTQAEG